MSRRAIHVYSAHRDCIFCRAPYSERGKPCRKRREARQRYARQR